LAGWKVAGWQVEGVWVRRPGGSIDAGAHAGFTLVELIVVLSVMTLAALAIVPSFIRFQQGEQLSSAARLTLALAGEARGLAVSRDTGVTLAYDPAAHGMRLSVDPPDTPPDPGAARTDPPVGERLTSDTRLLEYPLDVQVRIEGRGPAAGAAPTLHFYPDGRADPAQVTFDRSGFPPIQLEVNPRTGRLRIRDQAEL
jgi:prepilin-type N-terminal cleavage/methylation domain-containing protein